MTIRRRLYLALAAFGALAVFRIAPAYADAHSREWRQLFDGKDLAGWKHVGPGSFTVEDGLMRTNGGMGLLYWIGGKIGDGTLRVVYRMQHYNDNWRVFIRIPIEPCEPQMPVWYGYEVQIDNHPETSGENDYHITGTLYSLTKPVAKPGRPGPAWNTMDITLDGLRTLVVLNGVTVTDYAEGQPVPPRQFGYEPIRGPRPASGYFGLQNDSDKSLFISERLQLGLCDRSQTAAVNAGPTCHCSLSFDYGAGE